MDQELFQAIALGIIQGLTEFIPVSSSGHLAIAQNLFPGFKQPGVLLDVLLHAGTLAAVCGFFRRELITLARAILAALTRQDRDPDSERLLIAIIITSIPTAIIGLLIEDHAEAMFSSLTAVGLFLIATGAVLALGEIIAARAAPKPGPPRPLPAALIGIAQGLAVLPGLSRSASTISAARALGMTGPEAARFSFLASIPAIAGAAFLSLLKYRRELAAFSPSQIIAYIAGPLTAALVGFLALAFLMRVISKNRLVWFAPYCILAGAAAVLWGLMA